MTSPKRSAGRPRSNSGNSHLFSGQPVPRHESEGGFNIRDHSDAAAGPLGQAFTYQQCGGGRRIIRKKPSA